jgi:transposase
MAFIQHRTSRGKKYWSIVESQWIKGRSEPVILEYLGTADTLLNRLRKKDGSKIKSYRHGDTATLFNVAKELDIINMINKYVPDIKNGEKPSRDKLSVGTSLLLAAIGRACQPTSKMGWYDWAQTTSLGYCLKINIKKLDSRHFWNQMDFLPVNHIPDIENEIVSKFINTYEIKLDKLFYDTTNFFTFIDSANDHCEIPQRGKNKQKRIDLRQVGLALLVTGKEQLPLFHKTYHGNKNDITVFKEIFSSLSQRIESVTQEVTDITIVFDKGNNSKDNFAMIDAKEDLHYVAGLVSAYHKELIIEANKNFSTITIDKEKVPIFKIKKEVWGKERTCVVTVSKKLKEGQIRGIEQHLEKKYKTLEKFKQQLESPKRRKNFTEKEIVEHLSKTIKGQFINEILKYKIFELKSEKLSFTYYVDEDAYRELKNEILGRKILVTNRHDWSPEEVILTYRGQAKVEYTFRNLKNPYHLSVRPQYHWTDQKIKVHIFICILGYILTIAAYSKARNQAAYKRNLDNFMDDLKRIRLSCSVENMKRVHYRLESIDEDLQEVAKILGINDENIRPKLKLGV